MQLPPAAVEHMQAVVSRADTGPNSKVMDVGTGTGILLRFLQGSGVRQVGLCDLFHSGEWGVSSAIYAVEGVGEAGGVDCQEYHETVGPRIYSGSPVGRTLCRLQLWS